MATILSISFPFRQGVSSFPQPATDQDAIKSSIIQILMTPVGSRIMRRQFGSKLLKFLFDNDSPATAAGIEREVRTALGRWEPRIAIDAVQVESGTNNEPGQILITIFYTVVSSNTQDSVTVGGG